MIQPTIDYPPELPHPLLQGRSIANIDTMQKTTMLSGRDRYRRRFGKAPAKVSVQFKMRNDRSQIFTNWYNNELNDGVEWFNMRLRVDNGIKTYVAHFDGIYSGPNPEGFFYVTYSATIVLWERPVATDDEAAEAIIGESIADALEQLQDVNTHWLKGYWK